MKRLICIFLSIAMVMIMCSCGADDVTDQVVNVLQSENDYVLQVKGGTPEAYPGKEYGETFDKFFGAPTWKYFVGTKEGPDEDGDGEPDYVEENVDIVEFTGYCTYLDVEVKALIQFTLSKEDDTFQATYLSFNEVPQSMLMLSELLVAVFDAKDIDDTIENNKKDEYVSFIADDAKLLTIDEEDKLLTYMKKITKYGSVAFKTIDENELSTESYIKEFYRENFGNESGIVFLIDMDNRYIYLFSDGDIYDVVTKRYAEIITDNIYQYASDGEYYVCAYKAFEQVLDLLEGKDIS